MSRKVLEFLARNYDYQAWCIFRFTIFKFRFTIKILKKKNIKVD